MNNFFSYSFDGLFLIVAIGILSLIISTLFISTVISERTWIYLNSLQAIAQQTISKNDNKSVNENLHTANTITQASGHFANNQIKDGIVTWIQGGLWNLQISLPYNNMSNKSTGNNIEEKPNMTAVFSANFTMIKPDGSLSHSHVINNFTSDNVIFAGNDIIVTGIADIHSKDIGLEFKQVPMTVHLMGKKVLGLMINVNKTNGHFASSNEMFGTLISGIGLNGTSSSSTFANTSSNKVLIQLNK